MRVSFAVRILHTLASRVRSPSGISRHRRYSLIPHTSKHTRTHTPFAHHLQFSAHCLLIVHNRLIDQHILDSYKLDRYAAGPAIFTKREKGKDYYYNRPLWWTSAIHTCPCPYIHGALLKEQDSTLSSFIIHKTINLLLFRPIILRESSN